MDKSLRKELPKCWDKEISKRGKISIHQVRDYIYGRRKSIRYEIEEIAFDLIKEERARKKNREERYKELMVA